MSTKQRLKLYVYCQHIFIKAVSVKVKVTVLNQQLTLHVILYKQPHLTFLQCVKFFNVDIIGKESVQNLAVILAFMGSIPTIHYYFNDDTFAVSVLGWKYNVKFQTFLLLVSGPICAYRWRWACLGFSVYLLVQAL